MPYVIYARKSTESEDRQLLSIESQIEELKKLAARESVGVAEVLTESRSAKAPGRPVFNALMRKVHRGEIRGVLAWKMDRLARNHLDTGQVLQALADGLLERVITIDRTYTRDGNDRFIGNFEFGMATKYIDDLRQNVRRGNRARMARGWVNHTPPLGYRIEPVNKTIVKDPERFDLVRRMWDLLLTGTMRPPQIVRVANKEWGFRTRRFKRIGGCPLSPSTLYDMLANPFYYGLIQLRTGETFVGAHPPMISKGEFDRAQELLGRPGRQRPQKHDFPFTGLIRCGTCGGMLTAEEHRKPSGKIYVYYHCSRRKGDPPCPYQAISGQDLELQMLRQLGRLSMPEPVLAWLKKAVEHIFVGEVDRREQARKLVQDALTGIAREGETLLSLRLRDAITDDQFMAKKRQLAERKASLESKLQGTSQSAEQVKTLLAQTFDFSGRVGEVFLGGTKVQKRVILETVGSNFEVRAKKLTFCLRKPFSMLAEAAAISNWWAR